MSNVLVLSQVKVFYLMLELQSQKFFKFTKLNFFKILQFYSRLNTRTIIVH